MATRRGSALLTDSQVRAKRAPGAKLSEDRHGRGAGRLVVRWGIGDRRWFYFRYTAPDGKQYAIALPVATLAEARALVDGYATRAREARTAGRNLRDLLEEERNAEEAERRAQQAALERAQREAERGTLRVLCNAYVQHLERAAKQAAGDARRIFKRHVFETQPELAERQAASITPAEVTAMLRSVVDKGHGRTAGKLRSYLRAAYALAQGSALDANSPAALLALGIEHNPVAATRALSSFNRARDRVLNDAELGYYWAELERAEVSPARDALRLALLLGGQRPTQLLRCTPGDADLDAATLVLRDPKGRRTTPRLHVLPLSPAADAIVRERIRLAGDAPHLFSTHGKRATRIETAEELATEIFAAMARDPYLLETKSYGGPVQLRDVRRTCETQLARLGVSREVRAQLLSHGLGGVQQQHYDRHSYADEKRAALEQWQAHLAALLEARHAAEEAARSARRTGKLATARHRAKR